MLSSSQRFLQRILSGLTPEDSALASVELEGRIDSAFTDDLSWDRAAERLAVHDRRGPTRHWRWFLLVLVVVASLACMVSTLPALFRGLNTFYSFRFFGWKPAEETIDQAHRRQSAGLDPDQKLILFGEPKDLIARYPDQPDHYAAFGMDRAVNGPLPADFLETAKRIDPDNGWFPAFAGAVAAKDALKRVERTPEQSKAGIPRSWTVLDQKRVDTALEGMFQASRLPRFQSYKLEYLARQVQLMPPAIDYPTSMERLGFTMGRPSDVAAFRSLADVVCYRAKVLADAGDREGFHALVEAWKIVSRGKLDEDRLLIDVLVTGVSIQATTSAFHLAAQRLELQEEAARFGKVKEQLEEYIVALKTMGDEQQMFIIGHSSERDVWTSAVARQALRVTPLTFADLTPARLMERTAFTRAMVLYIYVAVAIAACLAALRGSGANQVSRRIAMRLSRCFRPVDWLWVVGACVFPLLYREALNRLTPLGGRDWAYFNNYDFTGARDHQFIAWLLLFLILPPLVTKWRLAKCLPHLDLGRTTRWLDRIVLVVALLTLPLSGLPYLSDPAYGYDYVGKVGVIILLVWLAASLLIVRWARDRAELRRQTVSRLLVPAFLFILLLLALMSSVYRIEERHWTKQDAASRLGSQANGINRYEDEIALARKSQLLEIFAPILK